jgi:hypothetical protein
VKLLSNCTTINIMKKFRLYCLLLFGLISLPSSAFAFDIEATYAKDCDTSCTASFTITASNGTAPYLFSIDSGATFQASATFTNLCAAEYDLMVTDANNDTATMAWTVWNFSLYNSTTLISDSFSMVYPSGYNVCDASVTLWPSGGAPPYTYVLNGVTQYGNPTFTGLCPGSVHYTVLDSGLHQTCWPVSSQIYNAPLNSGGCDTVVNSQGDSLTHCWHISQTGQVSQSASGSIDIPNPPQLTATPIDVTCFGAVDGGIIAFTQGGTPPFLYDFGFGFSPADNFFGLPPGTYTVTVIDALGFTDQATVLIFEPTELIPNSFSIDATCFGVCDGQVSAFGFGGTPPYLYSLNVGSFQPGTEFFGVCAGAYLVDIMDANGCIASDFATVNEPAEIVLSATATDPYCAGLCDGTISVNAGGGTLPYSYSLDGGAPQLGGTFTNVCNGLHSVEVIDANLCSAVIPVTLVEPQPLTSFNFVTDITCFGTCDGTVEAITAGGIGPYTYSLDGGSFQGFPIFSGLCAGNYILDVFDMNGCMFTDVATVFEPAQVLLTATSTDPLCGGSCDGTITATASGGTAPYQYSLNSGALQSSSVFTTLCAGTYSVEITDANTCTTSIPVTVFGSTPITVFSTATNVTCFGNCDGQIDVFPSGGQGPYMYSLNGGTFQAASTFTNLCPGSYTIDITDLNGCFATDGAVLIEPTELLATITGSDPLCAGSCDGMIDALAAGGTPPYQYSLAGSNFTSISTFTGLCAGTYNIDVMDANACITTEPYSLIDPVAVTLIITETGTSGVGICDGSILVEAVGGTGPYDISIDNGSTFSNSGAPILFDSLCAGTYTVIVFDANGCPNSGGAIIIDVQVRSSVWPGDANYDGTANNVDYLFVGLANAQTGSPRVPAQITWQAHTAQDWANDFLIGTNHKHADCDGDGAVSAADTTAIRTNYDLTHSTPPPFPNQANNNDPQLFFDISIDSAQANDIVHIDVVLGTAAKPVNAIHGIAFSVEYDTAIVDQGDIVMTYPPSFIGTPGNDTWTMVHDTYIDGIIDGAITRFDQSNSAGFGVIAELEIVMPDDVSGKKILIKYDTLFLETSDILALDASELELTIGWSNDSLLIWQESTGIDAPSQTFEVSTYPNPTLGTINVRGDQAIESYRLFTVAGQEVQSAGVGGQHNFMIQLEGLASGIYWLQLRGDNGIATRQIIKH